MNYMYLLARVQFKIETSLLLSCLSANKDQ